MVAMDWESPNVVCSSRTMIGCTNSAEAAPNTMKEGLGGGDFSIHISDSMNGAQREMQLQFQISELVD